MTTVSEIEQAVRQLSPDELAKFRSWFAQYDSDSWDRQVADDVSGGRLDAIADEAIEEFRSGQTTDL